MKVFYPVLTLSTSSNMVQVGNSSMLPGAHIGSLCIKSHVKPLTLKSGLHAPKLKHNLLSIQRICLDNYCNVIFLMVLLFL